MKKIICFILALAMVIITLLTSGCLIALATGATAGAAGTYYYMKGDNKPNSSSNADDNK